MGENSIITRKNQVSIRDFKDHEENPFLKNLRVPMTPKSNMFIKKDEAIVNLTDGDVKNDVLLVGKRKYVDSEDFIKLFTKELRVIFDLSKSTQQVFAYMLKKVGYEDKLIFNFSDCQKTTKYSRTTIFRALGELFKKEFIARNIGFVYWINPKLFYKGDRLVVMREYRKAKHKEVSPNQADLFGETQGIQKKLDQIDTP